MNEYGGSTVDQRVVEMRIDNDKFEAGAKKTISILESLDNSLNNLGRQNADGFANVEKTMDAVTSKFSIMGTVGDQVLRNLTNSAMGMANELKHAVETLTTAQIGAGWNKYADKTSAVQTIMAATHKDIGSIYADEADQMAKVNKELEKLTWFSDETSYSMLDMVNNIGKFTAAGRGLEESVKAMMGISNWAAISGGRPAEASRAMYNLSQALGVGAVTTIDWKSIEMANMATYEFKQMAIETAEQMGILRRVSDKTWETVEGNYEVTVEKFRDTLSFGKGDDKVQWFNSDVLLKVLSQYGSFAEKLQETISDLEELTGETYLAKDILDAISDFQNGLSIDPELVPYIQELAGAEYELGRRAFVAAQEAKTFQEVMDATKDAVSTKWMNLFEKIFGNYMQAKDLFSNMAEVFYDIFAGPVEKLNDIADIVFGENENSLAYAIDEFGNLIREGPFDGFVDTLENISVAVDDVGNTIQGTVDAISSAAFGSLDTITEHAETTYKNLKAIADIFNSKDRDAFIHKFEWDKINLAGYATEEFKLAVIEAAEELGTLKKVSDDVWQSISTGQKVTVGNFTETLGNTATDGWLTNNILSSEFLKIESGIEKLDSFATRLVDAGYKIPKFWDSLNETLGKQRVDKIAEQYGTMVDAIKQGGITSDEFRHALELVAKEAGHTQDEIAAINELIEDSDNLFKRLKDGSLEFYVKFKAVGEDSAEEVDSLDSRLKKAGRTMDDLQEALRKVDETRFDSIIAEYGTLDRALKEGAIDAEYFRRAMEEMANNTTKSVDGATQSFTELREVAMQVLRGDWGNGEERAKRLLEAGYDYDTIQWLAGNLGWMIGQGWDVSQISDEYIMSLAKPEHVAAVLEGTVGAVQYTEEEIAAMNDLLDECDVLLEQVASGALDVYDAYNSLDGAMQDKFIKKVSGTELMIISFKNFLQFFDDVAGSISDAVDKVFGTSEVRAERWGRVIEGIYNFSRSIQFGEHKIEGMVTPYERLVNVFSGFLRIIQSIGKIFRGVWSIVSPVLGFAVRLIGSIIEGVGTLLSRIGDLFESLSENVRTDKIFGEFKLGAWLSELASHLTIVVDLFEILGTVVAAIVGVFVSAGAAVYEFVANSKILSSLLSFISNAFQKVEGVISRVANYIREAYETAEEGNKVKAAITALLGSVERGFKRIIPYGEQIWAFFAGIWDSLKGGFGNIGALILAPFAAIESGFKKLWAAIKGEDADADEVEEKLHPIRDAFNTLLTSIFAKPEEIKSRVTQFLGSIWGGIKEFVSTIRFRDVVSMLRLAVVTTIAGDLLEFINTFKYIRLGVNDLIESIGYTFENISMMIRNLSVNFRAGAMIKMAIAIGIISFCIYKLSKLAMDNPDAEDKITYVAAIIAILMLMMSRIAKSLASSNALTHVDIKQFTVIPQMMGTLIGLAALVAATAFAMHKIGKIGDWKAILAAFAPIGVILFMIGALLYTVTKAIIKINDTSIQANKVTATGKAIRNVGRALGSIAAAMLMLMIPIGVFAYIAAKYESGSDALWNAIGKVGAIFGGIILGLGLLTLALIPFRNNAEAIRGIGGTLLRMSVAMMIMAMAISALLIPIGILSFVISRIENQEALQQGFVAVGVMLAALFAFLAGVIIVARKSTAEQITAVGKLFARMGGAILALGASILLLMVPILALAAMGKDHMAEIEKAFDIVFKMLALMGLLAIAVTAFAVNASSTDNIKAFGNALIKMGLAMVLFSAGALLFDAALLGMLFVIERFSEKLKGLENLRETLITLGIIAGAMLAFGIAAKFLGSGLILITLAFGIFAASLWVLAHALDAIADATPRFITAMNKVQRKYSASTLKGVAKTALIITAVVAALALLLGIIIKLKSKGGFIGTIFNWISKLGTSAKNLGINLLAGLTTAASKLPSALVTFFSKFGKALMDNKESLITSLSAMIAVIGLYVVGIIPTMTESIITAIIQLIDSVANSLEEHRTEIKAALTNLVGAIIDILGDVISSIFEGLGWDPIVNWLSGNGKKISTKAKNGTSGSEGVNELPEGFGNVPDRGRTALMVGAIAVAYNWLKGKKSIPVLGSTTTGSGSTGPLDSLFDRGKQVGGNQSGSVVSKAVDHVVLKNTIKSAINESSVSKEGIGGGTGDDTLSPVKYGAHLLKLGLIYAGFKLATTEIAGNEWGKYNAKEAYNGGSNEKIEDVLVAISSTLDEEYKHRTSSYRNSPFYDRYHSTNIMFDKSKQVALDKTFEDLQAFIPDLELENFKRQYEEAIDPIAKYIGLAFQHKDANAKLAKSYENIVSELKLSKEAEEVFYESLKHTNDVEQTLSELVYSRYLSVDDINAISDYVDKSVNLEEAVQKLNDYYDILAKRLGITREEFDAQLEAANGLVGNMPAYKEYFEGFTDLLTIASDGSIQLTEKGIIYFEAQRKAAEEATKAAEFEILKQEELKRILEGSEYESAEQAQKYAEAHQALVKEAEDYRKALIEEYKNLGVDTSDVEQMSVTDLLQSREEATNDINAWGDGVKADIKAQIGKLKDEFGINFSLDSLSSMSGFDLFGLFTGNLTPEQMGELSSEYGLSLDEGLGFGINSEEGKKYISDSLSEVLGGEGSYIDELIRGSDFLNINSPSKLFEEYGISSDEGYAKGILSKEGRGFIAKAIKQVFSATIKALGQTNTGIGAAVSLFGKPSEINDDCKRIGNNAAINLIKGIIAKYKDARLSGKNIARSFIDAFKSEASDNMPFDIQSASFGFSNSGNKKTLKNVDKIEKYQNKSLNTLFDIRLLGNADNITNEYIWDTLKRILSSVKNLENQLSASNGPISNKIHEDKLTKDYTLTTKVNDPDIITNEHFWNILKSIAISVKKIENALLTVNRPISNKFHEDKPTKDYTLTTKDNDSDIITNEHFWNILKSIAISVKKIENKLTSISDPINNKLYKEKPVNDFTLNTKDKDNDPDIITNEHFWNVLKSIAISVKKIENKLLNNELPNTTDQLQFNYDIENLYNLLAWHLEYLNNTNHPRLQKTIAIAGKRIEDALSQTLSNLSNYIIKISSTISNVISVFASIIEIIIKAINILFEQAPKILDAIEMIIQTAGRQIEARIVFLTSEMVKLLSALLGNQAMDGFTLLDILEAIKAIDIDKIFSYIHDSYIKLVAIWTNTTNIYDWLMWFAPILVHIESMLNDGINVRIIEDKHGPSPHSDSSRTISNGPSPHSDSSRSATLSKDLRKTFDEFLEKHDHFNTLDGGGGSSSFGVYNDKEIVEPSAVNKVAKKTTSLWKDVTNILEGLSLTGQIMQNEVLTGFDETTNEFVRYDNIWQRIVYALKNSGKSAAGAFGANNFTDYAAASNKIVDEAINKRFEEVHNSIDKDNWSTTNPIPEIDWSNWDASLNDVNNNPIEVLSENVKSNEKDINEAIASITFGMSSAMEKLTTEFSNYGTEIPKDTASGITKEKKRPQNAVSTMGTELKTPMSSVPNSFFSYGAQIASSLASGIRSRISEVQAASRQLENASRNVSSGISNGVETSSPAVEKAGISLADKLKNAFTKKLQIKSPSRVFMKLAEYVPQGIAEGVENEEDTAIDSVVVLSQDLIDAVQKSMAQVGVMAQDGFGEELSLKPVVDFSGMSSDIQRMNSVLTNAASMQALRNIGNPSAFNYNTENYSNRNQNKEILDEMHTLSNKLGRLGQDISNMQVVLNTGVLCGELASGVNSKLGGMATRQRR